MVIELDNQDEFSALREEISSWLAGAQVVGHPLNPGLEIFAPGEMPACVRRVQELINSQMEKISKQACRKSQTGVLIRS